MGFPKVVIAIMFVLLMWDSMTMTMVFSYLPYLVKSFGIAEPNVGYYAGVLGSSFFMAAIFSSFLWGYVIDVKGKRFATLAASISLMVATLSFGLSTNIYIAFITRFWQGGSLGLIIIAKSYVAELCTGSHLSIGMSIVVSSFDVGLILGPSIAGFLAFPAEQFPNVFSEDGIFGKFGILLPNLLIVFGFAISIPIAMIFLPRDTEYSPIVGMNEESRRLLSNSVQSTYSASFRDDIKECSAMHSKIGFRNTRVGRALSSKKSLYAILLYGTFSFCAIGYEELFPVFAATSSDYNGLHLSPSQIGEIYLIAAVSMIFLLFTAISLMSRRNGAYNTYIVLTLVAGLFIPTVPAVVFIGDSSLQWWVMVCGQVIIRSTLAGAFTQVNIILNESSSKDLLGTINGLGMTISCIGRAVAPSCFSSIFAWSLRNVKGVNDHAVGMFINQFFSFWLLAFMCFFTVAALMCSPALDEDKNIVCD